MATFTTPVLFNDEPNNRFVIIDRGCNKIRQLAGGNVTTFAGNGTAGYADTAASASNYSAVEFNFPGKIADSEELYFVIDQNGAVVRALDDPGFGVFSAVGFAGSYRSIGFSYGASGVADSFGQIGRASCRERV